MDLDLDLGLCLDLGLGLGLDLDLGNMLKPDKHYKEPMYEFFEVKDWLMFTHKISREEFRVFWSWLCNDMENVQNGGETTLYQETLDTLIDEGRPAPIILWYSLIMEHFAEGQDSVTMTVNW